MAAAPLDPDRTGQSLLVRIYSYWSQFVGIYASSVEALAQVMWFGFIVWLWIDTFLRLRRNPLAVTRNVACFAGCLFGVILLRVPEDIGYLLNAIRLRELWERRAYFETTSVLGVRFLCLAILVAILIFAGELSQAARLRILHAEWMTGKNAPEEERRKWRRREALILTVRGPQLSLHFAVVRMLALVAAPFAVVSGISGMASKIWDFEQRDLPAPLMTKTGPTAIGPQRLAGKIRIDIDGRIYLDSVLAAHPSDTDCLRLVGWLRRHPVGPERAFLLQVHPEVRLQRLVEVMSAADRAGVRLAQEE